MRRAKRGGALVEFALAWPVALIVMLGGVQVALWATESFAARAAAIAGARAAGAAGATPATGAAVAVRSLQPAVFGATVITGCAPVPPRGRLQVCARDLGGSVEVDVEGSVPALVPLMPGGGLAVSARVDVQKEVFTL